MAKKSYWSISSVKSESVGNGKSRKILSRSELDKIAKEEGFVFDRKLALGNRLYVNSEEDSKRIYNKYGNIVDTYSPKRCPNFHQPVEGVIIKLNSGIQQFRGRNKYSQHS